MRRTLVVKGLIVLFNLDDEALVNLLLFGSLNWIFKENIQKIKSSNYFYVFFLIEKAHNKIVKCKIKILFQQNWLVVLKLR